MLGLAATPKFLDHLFDIDQKENGTGKKGLIAGLNFIVQDRASVYNEKKTRRAYSFAAIYLDILPFLVASFVQLLY